MELIREAGIFGAAAVVVFVVGLVATLGVGRARGAALTTATPFVLAVLALGQIGQGEGQRHVRAALASVPDLANRLTLLNEGTGEAAANLVVSGTAALTLAILGAVVAFVDERAR
jgi:hypothetical protein